MASHANNSIPLKNIPFSQWSKLHSQFFPSKKALNALAKDTLDHPVPPQADLPIFIQTISGEKPLTTVQDLVVKLANLHDLRELSRSIADLDKIIPIQLSDLLLHRREELRKSDDILLRHPFAEFAKRKNLRSPVSSLLSLVEVVAAENSSQTGVELALELSSSQIFQLAPLAMELLSQLYSIPFSSLSLTSVQHSSFVPVSHSAPWSSSADPRRPQLVSDDLQSDKSPSQPASSLLLEPLPQPQAELIRTNSTAALMPSSSAASQIHSAALLFNDQIKAPRTGVTACDPNLWSFSAGIQPSRDVVEYLKGRFEIIRPQLLSIFEETLNDRFKPSEFPFEFKLDCVQGGSVANQTYLISPDLDLYLVINSTKSLRSKQGVNGDLQYAGSDEKIVNAATVTTISSACVAAMSQFLLNQESLKPTDFISKGMTVFTLKEAAESFAGLQLEFDVVPVLKVIGNKFLLLDGKDGKLVPSSTQLAAHMIGTQAQAFPGLREMMVVLKLVHKAGIKQGLCSLASVPSCGLEMAVLLVVKERRERAAAWWRDSSFTIIFRAAIAQLLDRIPSGAQLPAPNDPTDDVLRGIRTDPTEFTGYYTRWQLIPESGLLAALKDCLNQISLPNSTEVTPTQPTCSSSGDLSGLSNDTPNLPATSAQGSSPPTTTPWFVSEWLTSLGMERYLPNFVDNDMDKPDLIRGLSKEEIKTGLSIQSFGAIKTIFEAAQKL